MKVTLSIVFLFKMDIASKSTLIKRAAQKGYCVGLLRCFRFILSWKDRFPGKELVINFIAPNEKEN